MNRKKEERAGYCFCDISPKFKIQLKQLLIAVKASLFEQWLLSTSLASNSLQHSFSADNNTTMHLAHMKRLINFPPRASDQYFARGIPLCFGKLGPYFQWTVLVFNDLLFVALWSLLWPHQSMRPPLTPVNMHSGHEITVNDMVSSSGGRSTQIFYL